MVVRRPQVAPGDSECEGPLAVAPGQVAVALQGEQILECPDWREAADMADAPPAVTWYHVRTRRFASADRHGKRPQVKYVSFFSECLSVDACVSLRLCVCVCLHFGCASLCVRMSGVFAV